MLRIELANQVSFLNRVALSKALDAVPQGGHVLIDARRTDYIDADVQDLIWEYIEEIAPARGVEVSMLGLKEHYEQLEDRVQYVDYTTREMQASLTPEKVQQILEEGNERFRTGQQLTRDLTRQLEATAEKQHPLAIMLSGASSRTPVEMIFDVGIGRDLLRPRHGQLGQRWRARQPRIRVRRGRSQTDRRHGAQQQCDHEDGRRIVPDASSAVRTPPAAPISIRSWPRFRSRSIRLD